MQTGAYVLHVSCDNNDCPRGDPSDSRWNPGNVEFVGATRKRARRKAQEAGWKLAGAHRNRDLCPYCT